MKILKITWKSILEQVRDYRTLLVSFSFPISFMIIFGWVMGANYYTANVFVLNRDKGIEVTIEKEGGVKLQEKKFLSRELIEILEKAAYQDGTNIFRIKKITDKSQMGKRLEKREYSALLIIPEEFTAAIHSIGNKEKSVFISNPTVVVAGDPSSPMFSLVKLIFDAVFDNFLAIKSGYRPPVGTTVSFTSASEGHASDFTYLVPGLMIMAIYILLIQAAMILAQEVENRTIIRLKMSGVHTWEFLTGVSLSQVAFAMLMVPLMLYTAVMMGFSSKGSLIIGIFFGVLASLSATAIALITAAISKTEKEAFLWGNIISIPVIFFSGVFFPLPEITLFKIGGNSFTLFDLQPTTHAHKAFLQVFLYGAGIGDLIYETIMLILITIIYFLIGVVLYRRAHLRYY